MKSKLALMLAVMALSLTGCETIDPGTPAQTNPWDGAKVHQLCGSPVFDWEQTVTISSVNVGATVQWTFKDATPITRDWSQHGKLNGTLHLTWQGLGGEWVTANSESLKTGANVQTRDIFQSDRGNKKFWAPPYQECVIAKGTPVWMCLSTGSWYWSGTTKERSNWIRMIAP